MSRQGANIRRTKKQDNFFFTKLVSVETSLTSVSLGAKQEFLFRNFLIPVSGCARLPSFANYFLFSVTSQLLAGCKEAVRQRNDSFQP